MVEVCRYRDLKNCSMVNPVLALFVFLVVAVAMAVLFWPGRGLVWYWYRVLRNSEWMQVEDALKHLYEREYTDRQASAESLADCLNIRDNRAVALLQRLDELGLVVTRGTTFQLTTDGRRAALRVIRVHRLWERYLADHTGLKETNWHAVADRLEHTTPASEVEAMSIRMGAPRYDPHGDPIPLPDGNMPDQRGFALTELSAGQPATIVHVEDEPDTVYAQLVAEGLSPGMVVRVIESTPSRIRFDADGEEIVLAPIVAASITVLPVSREDSQRNDEALERLSSLRESEQGTVLGISPACRGIQLRRLLDLGLVRGTEVTAELVSPTGDPTAYRVRGALIALRRAQANLIYITRIKPEAG